MRWLPAAAVLCGAALWAQNAGLTQIHSIYILPMRAGVDQFLANRITRLGKMQVVADPQHADAILTDSLGEAFEKKLDELYPAPADMANATDTEDQDDNTADAKKDDSGQLRPSSFGHGRGTYFLVDRKSRNVVWSAYVRPRRSQPDDLDHVAEQVVHKLKHDLTPSQPGS